MKPRRTWAVRALSVALLLVFSVSAEERAESVERPSFLGPRPSANNPNPNQVAILRWYAANETANFPVGSAPYGVAFDGANIWVANGGSSSLTKLRASDGTNLGTFDVGASPRSVAFDSANVWVVNGGSFNVTKLRAIDGNNLGTFPVGASPTGVAFDGANIWVANNGSNTVSKR
jgi:hypothetical protein